MSPRLYENEMIINNSNVQLHVPVPVPVLISPRSTKVVPELYRNVFYLHVMIDICPFVALRQRRDS